MSIKKLYIIRHAKAETPSWGKNDFDRVLIEKGKQRASLVADQLKEAIPEINERVTVLSSTATRAAETAKICCNIIGYSEDNIKWKASIFEADYPTILRSINEINPCYDTVVVFGHNPGLSDLVRYISGQFINLKTANIACLELEEGINFAELTENTALLTKVINSIED